MLFTWFLLMCANEVLYNVIIYKTYKNLDQNTDFPLEFENLEEKSSQTKRLRLCE
jgi:hypothetical protein